MSGTSTSDTSASDAARPTAETTVLVKWLPHGEGLPLPRYATMGAAGCDLAAAVPADAPVVLAPGGGRALVPTGLVLALAPGFEAQVRPRSGLAHRHGVSVLNTPGTVDADYRGEVFVLLVNFGDRPFAIERGMRIAQMVVAPVSRARFVSSDEMGSTDRGQGGFGSTGV